LNSNPPSLSIWIFSVLEISGANVLDASIDREVENLSQEGDDIEEWLLDELRISG